jgi:hypothetical protein
MTVGNTMKWMGRSARNRAESVGHQMKDRALEKRLGRASDEAERLRLENDLLRDEVEETRSEHRRIFDLLEDRLSKAPEVEVEVETEKKSHKGRWLLLIATLGGVWAWRRMRSDGTGTDEWSGPQGETPGLSHGGMTQTGTGTI